MSSDGPRRRLRENATGVASTIVTGLWLAALLSGQDWWLAALLFGYVVVVPLVALLFGDEEDRDEWWDDWWSDEDERADEPSEERLDSDGQEALDVLRQRYAEGDLTDEQFERKLDRLLEVETLEDLEDRSRERSAEPETESGR